MIKGGAKRMVLRCVSLPATPVVVLTTSLRNRPSARLTRIALRSHRAARGGRAPPELMGYIGGRGGPDLPAWASLLPRKIITLNTPCTFAQDLRVFGFGYGGPDLPGWTFLLPGKITTLKPPRTFADLTGPLDVQKSGIQR